MGVLHSLFALLLQQRSTPVKKCTLKKTEGFSLFNVKLSTFMFFVLSVEMFYICPVIFSSQFIPVSLFEMIFVIVGVSFGFSNGQFWSSSIAQHPC
jgi:hypothetical protein